MHAKQTNRLITLLLICLVVVSSASVTAQPTFTPVVIDGNLLRLEIDQVMWLEDRTVYPTIQGAGLLIFSGRVIGGEANYGVLNAGLNYFENNIYLESNGLEIMSTADDSAQARDINFPNARYLGTRAVMDGHHPITIYGAGQSVDIVIAFDLPTPPEGIVALGLWDGQILLGRGSFGVQVVFQGDQQHYSFYPINLPPLITFTSTAPEILDTPLEVGEIFRTGNQFDQVIAYDSVDLNNCNSSGTYTDTKTFSFTTIRQVHFTIGGEAEFQTVGITSTGIGLVRAHLEAEFGFDEGREITETRTLSFSVGPDTHEQREVSWVMLSTTGVIELLNGGIPQFVEFSVDSTLSIRSGEAENIPCE